MAYGCGDMVPTPLSLVGPGGGSLPFFIEGADPDLGGTNGQIINMSSHVGDYVFPSGGTFLICIETDDPIEVQLADGTDFTITQAQVTANLGYFMPYLILKVYKTGTTGTFSVGR